MSLIKVLISLFISLFPKIWFTGKIFVPSKNFLIFFFFISNSLKLIEMKIPNNEIAF